MKTKNVVLGLAALVFAVGSAFTTIVPPEYISVDFDDAPGFTCIAISEDFECDGATNSLCKINVLLKGGTLAQAQVYELNSDVVNCTTALFDTNGVVGNYPTTGTPIIAVH
jgi:hypothetical protein